MRRIDLEAAGIPYVDATGRFADFHSLRHTMGSMLAASGIHPKTAQILMRHENINSTMQKYTHSFRGQEKTAVEGLPDLSLPHREMEKATATGTDGRENIIEIQSNNFAKNSAKPCGRQKTTLDCYGQLEGKTLINKSGCKSRITKEKEVFIAGNEVLNIKGGSGIRTHDNGFAIRRLSPLGHAALKFFYYTCPT